MGVKDGGRVTRPNNVEFLCALKPPDSLVNHGTRTVLKLIDNQHDTTILLTLKPFLGVILVLIASGQKHNRRCIANPDIGIDGLTLFV